MTTFDFEDGCGPVPAHQHPNGGGWVADTAYVAEAALVGPNAQVSGNALVYGNAQVYDNARVYDNAWVYGNAQVSGDAIIDNNKYPEVKRSDNYTFIAVPCKDGETRVIAGCRYFTFEEAHKHWTETRGGTPLGDETMLILEYLKKYVEMMK